jgi:iron complex outermembrane recepter protein
MRISRLRLRRRLGCAKQTGVAAVTTALLWLFSSAALAQDAKFNLDVSPDTLIEVLKQLRSLTNSAIVYSPQQLDGARSTGLSGSFTVTGALTELLRGTAFTFAVDGRGTIVVTPLPQSAAAAPPALTPARDDQIPIEEIIVSAEKRNEPAIDVPESVSALTGATLSERGLNGINDYGTYVPGLTVLSNQRGFGQIVLRGITTGSTQPTASVGTYIDDVPFSSTTSFAGGNLVIADIDPFDIERIEIDRGPQGTLYGAGTLAGVLKYVTAPPALGVVESRGELDGGSTGGGGFDEAGKALVNAPLGDQAALRADLYERRDSGFITDIGTGNKGENTNDLEGGRLSLLVQPRPDISLRLTSLLQHRQVGGTASVDVDPNTLDLVFGDLRESRQLRESASQDYALTDLVLSWDLGPAALVSSTSYSRSLARAVSDVSDTTGPGLQALDTLKAAPTVESATNFSTGKFTEEIRLASPETRDLNWLVGAFYTYEESEARGSLEASLDGQTLPGADAHPLTEAEPSRFRDYAGFADLDYYFFPDFDVTAGARFSRNRQSFNQTLSGQFNNILDPMLVSTGIGASAESSVTFRLAPRYRLSDDIITYAEISSGFQPGGPNVPTPESIITSSTAPLNFASDSLINYEIGFKGELLNKRLSFDTSAFLINLRRIQLAVSDLGPFGTAGFVQESNGGSASSRGFEAEASYNPIDGVVLGLSTAYISAVLDSNAPAVGGIVGDRLPTVPRWSAAATADYEFPLAGDLDGILGTTFRVISDRDTSFTNDFAMPNRLLPGYGQLDLRAGLARDPFTLSLFVDNALNERGIVDLENTSTIARETIIRPISFGIQLTAGF